MNPTDAILKLTAYLLSLGNGRNLRSDDEKADYTTRYNEAQGCLSQLVNPPNPRRVAALAEARAERVAWLGKEEELTTEISSFKDWRTAATLREKMPSLERQSVLKHQLRRLRDGTLYVSPGKTFGTLDVIEQRIAELEARVAREQAAFDAALAAAERILAAVEVTT